MEILKIENLTVTFHKKDILKEINFSLNEKEIIWIRGKSGEGKTTLLKTISGLVKKYQGKIIVSGENIKNIPSKTLTTKIQMIFQDPYSSLFPLWSVEEILKEPLNFFSLNKTTAELEKEISKFRLPSHTLTKLPQNLSTGEKQKIAILRALLLDPKIILADEPFSSLDIFNQKEIKNIFQKEKEKRSFLIVSHNNNFIEELADTIITIHQGKIAEIIRKK